MHKESVMSQIPVNEQCICNKQQLQNDNEAHKNFNGGFLANMDAQKKYDINGANTFAQNEMMAQLAQRNARMKGNSSSSSSSSSSSKSQKPSQKMESSQKKESAPYKINKRPKDDVDEKERLLNEYLDSLNISEVVMNKMGTENRKKAIKLLTKILTKVVEKPQEEKFQDLNYNKMSQKFEQYPVMIDLCKLAGFQIETNNNHKRLKLNHKNNNCQYVLLKLNSAIKHEEDKLEKARQEVIERNKQRLNTKANLKKKQMKDKILANHNDQMKLAKQGIYNVGKTVADKKGTGTGVNSLKY